jgi:hypothetical protein
VLDLMLLIRARHECIQATLWAVVAAFLTLQAPVMFAVNGGPPKKKPRIDLQIQQIEAKRTRLWRNPRHCSSGRDPRLDFALAALKARGITVDPPGAPRKRNCAAPLSQLDLSWLESLDGIGSIAGDPVVHPSQLSLPNGTTPLAPQPTIANELRKQLGLTESDAKGAGIGIAIVDSGIAAVPDLADRITRSTTSQRSAWSSDDPVDGYGHGTHVAGLAAGSGGSLERPVRGRCAAAHISSALVYSTTPARASTSDVIAAIEFATANKYALGIDVHQPVTRPPAVQHRG